MIVIIHVIISMWSDCLTKKSQGATWQPRSQVQPGEHGAV